VCLLISEGATFGQQAECRLLLSAHAQDHVSCLCANSKLGLLASAGTDGTLRVWYIHTYIHAPSASGYPLTSLIVLHLYQYICPHTTI
jgi:hypothetical protein